MQPTDASHSNTPQNTRTVLVTGATGYIGGRLVPRLLEAGHTVKVLVRTPQKIADVPWHDDVEIVENSLSDADGLTESFSGVEVLYYLVHSMASGSGFEAKEEAMARLVADAAAEAGVERIVYLGGLHPEDTELSTHMRSRETVGKVFLESPVDSIVFQAGVVIGSGSAGTASAAVSDCGAGVRRQSQAATSATSKQGMPETTQAADTPQVAATALTSRLPMRVVPTKSG